MAKVLPPEGMDAALGWAYRTAREEAATLELTEEDRYLRQIAVSAVVQSLTVAMMTADDTLDLVALVTGLGTALGVTFSRTMVAAEDRDRLLALLVDAASEAQAQVTRGERQ